MLRPTIKSGLLISWAGMRGIVSLAAALALPPGFPYRDLIVLTAFAVVLGTLVIQGLTLKALLRALDLHDDDPVGREARAARERALSAGLASLANDESPSPPRSVRSSRRISRINQAARPPVRGPGRCTAISIGRPSRPRGKPSSPCAPPTRSATTHFIGLKRNWTGSRWPGVATTTEPGSFARATRVEAWFGYRSDANASCLSPANVEEGTDDEAPPGPASYAEVSMRSAALLPEDIEEYRDGRWLREGPRVVETAYDAERFIERVGFAACLTDTRRPGPSLYVAVCGRRDAVMPRNVQKDPEASHTWRLKDEVVRRGNVYYGKLAGARTLFLARRMIPYFNAVWGLKRAEERTRLSRPAQALLRVLRREWEIATSDLRNDARMNDRPAFTRALDELQAAMLVIPSEVYYQPKFTYIWTLGLGRFPDALRKRVSRDVALREIARGFLANAGMTVRGELARVTGLSRADAGRGNRALVAEGFAEMLGTGVYRLTPPAAPPGPNEPGTAVTRTA